jgi:hypothetical protein
VLRLWPRRSCAPIDYAAAPMGETGPDLRTSGCRGNEYRDVAVQVRQAAIESRQLPFAASCELSKVGICYLSVTDHTSDLYIGERDTVGPELVAIRTLDYFDDIARSCRGLPHPHQESNKTSLCDRARRKSCVGCR